MSADSPAAVLVDGDGNLVNVTEDDGVLRLAILGKVVIAPSPIPDTATAVTIAADTPLVVGAQPSIHSTEYIIPDGEAFTLQQLTAGAEGDPTEKGSKVEVYYFDGTVDHLIERVYVSGFSLSTSYPDVELARDGTPMVGDGSTKKIRIDRIRMSGTAQELDSVVRGFVQ